MIIDVILPKAKYPRMSFVHSVFPEPDSPEIMTTWGSRSLHILVYDAEAKANKWLEEHTN